MGSTERTVSGEELKDSSTVGVGQDDGQIDRLRTPVDLFVRNLSFKTNEEALKNFFAQYGEVQYAEVGLHMSLQILPTVPRALLSDVHWEGDA